MAMAILIIEDVITDEQVVLAREDYPNYIKIVVDIEKGILAVGGEWHADAEAVLLASGSKQEDLWGGGLDLLVKEVEFVSMINIRSGLNSSTEVLDQQIRDKMEIITKKAFQL